ncbi:hypothetical protein M758_1G015900 [Ceratodon purpureus]|nr:hypothetical protein M758_1G015900 [Ceratodon purpureus]
MLEISYTAREAKFAREEEQNQTGDWARSCIWISSGLAIPQSSPAAETPPASEGVTIKCRKVSLTPAADDPTKKSSHERKLDGKGESIRKTEGERRVKKPEFK